MRINFSKKFNLLRIPILLLSLFTLTSFANAASAKLYLSPASESYYVGQYFSVDVLVDTGGNLTNAYKAVLAYPTDKLEAVAVSGGGSICDLWLTQTKTTLECGATTPYKGSAGRIGTIDFRVKAAGPATVSVAAGNVKKHDGRGTEILSVREAAVFDLQETPEGVPAISSSTHSNQDAWYQEKTATLNWTTPSGTDGFSYVLSTRSTEIPDDNSEGTETTKTYEGLADGPWYFHLKARSGISWSNTGHFRLQIDSTPPADFEIVVDPPGDRIARAPLLSFAATDALSGIDHYEIAMDGTDFTTTTSPYQFERIRGGVHEITVRAVDRAGNVKEAEVTIDVIGVSAPTITRPAEGDQIPLFGPLEITATSTALGRIELALDGKVIATLDSPETDYTYRKLLSPREHELTAVFLNADGIESEPAAVKFRINPWAVNLFGLIVPGYLFYPLLLAALAGLILLARRWIRKVRTAIKNRREKPESPGPRIMEIEKPAPEAPAEPENPAEKPKSPSDKRD